MMDIYGFSPDIGKYVRRGKQYFTETGGVYEFSINSAFRTMDYGPIKPTQENYADWSETKRAEMQAACKAESEAFDKEKAELQKAQDVLVESARGKLTEEEFQAVYRSGYEDGRGY